VTEILAGLNALTLLFMGSAVVALERFARATRKLSTVAVCGVLWSGVLGGAVVYLGSAELGSAPFEQKLVAWASASISSVLVVAVAVAITHTVLRTMSPARLGLSVIVVLGLGAALVLGASGRVLFASAPVGVAVALAALLAIRRRGGSDGPSELEAMCWTLAASMAVGVGVALFVPAPAEGIATGGALLLALLGISVAVGLIPLAGAGILDTRHTAEWFIAVRYLVAKRRQTFISVITGICVVGIAAGVWLIITVLSVMNGFERTWREEIIGNRAHFTVHSGLGPIEDYEEVLEAVLGTEGVVSASPYVDAEGMVRGDGGQIMAVRVRGVDPKRVTEVTDLADDLQTEGALAELEADTTPGAEPAILIGGQLSSALGVAVGDSLVLISPFGGPQTPLGPAPRLKRFRVAGIFKSSFFQYDEVFTYVNLAAAQDFRRVGDVVDGIEGRTTDFYRSRGVGDAVRNNLGFPYYTRDWKDFFPAFFQALKSERVMMFILLTMIMVVAAFSIVSTLVMMIMEKSGDIAILKAMGARDGSIERIFALEGTLIGLVGTAFGVIAGISVTAHIGWIQQRIEAVVGIDTLPAEVYQFSTLPAELDAGQIAVAVGVAMVLSLGATLLPSRQAARLDPVESLRYE
jgi:lipoprotein-releasing system permease protein